MSELHRGDPLQVSIETATIDGSGVARVDGQVVFVPGALPDERCSVTLPTSAVQPCLPSFFPF